MSDSSQGSGWWMASDGLWYAPDKAPPGFHPPGMAYNTVDGVPTLHGPARTALILGILSLFCVGLILGPIAVFIATRARTEIAANPALTGDGMAMTGLICGALGFFSSLALFYWLLAV
jgi:hypothetical protein